MSEYINMSFQDEDPNLVGGNTIMVQEITLKEFGLGRGTIDPANRGIDTKYPVESEKVQELKFRLVNGELLKDVNLGSDIPSDCVDGRGNSQDPSSAGGSYGLAIAKNLSDDINIDDVKDEKSYLSKIYNRIKSRGKKIGVHDDNHPGGCGCGACAKAKEIVGYISTDIDKMISVYDQLDIPFGSVAESIKNKADSLFRSDEFFDENRTDALNVATEEGGQCAVLEGEHKELFVFLNFVKGKTVDQEAIRAEYGDNYDLFVVDVWSFENAAEVLSDTSDEKGRFIAALALYNLATASQLSSENMPIVNNKDFALAA